MTNSKNIPRRRFSGFDGEWEQRKLANIASMHARIGWQNLRTSEFLDNGDYYLITGTDFLSGRINFEKCHYVNKERYQQDKNIQVGEGSILITKDGTLGKVALVTELNKPATLNAGVFNVVVKDPSINETYLYQYLAAPFLMDYVSKRATGGTIKHLNQGILVDFPIEIPSYKEQETIGQFLGCLDNAVTLHQHKLDKLKNLKKSYLAELFPAEGERVPKRRFPGFEGEWEKKKLGEVVEKFDNLRIPVTSKDRIAGNIPYYGANGIQDYVKGFTHDGEFVLLAEDGANDLKDYPVQYVNGKVWVNNHAHVIQGKNNLIDNKFLLFAIKQIQMEPYLVGGGRAKLNAEIMMNLPLIAPGISEQRMIGEFLMKVEKQISLQQQKLDKLKDLKKAYLNELFI